ncbi:MAG: Zn-dependent hydrolase [Spirochaetae bacterium HGW-Spirochaetae-5]|nr:MAG: Zn-dependent hydrolase [Spirochaetae bacterium HGW-Spirochaetae-5]
MLIKNNDTGLTSITLKSGIFPYQLEICLYIVDGILIDTGSANTLSKLKRVLNKEKISCAAITHVHEDHTGAASWIKRNLNIPVYLHNDSISEAAVKTSIPLYRRLVWGNRDGFDADPMPLFIETGRYRLDVIEAPGHHNNHMVFHEKKMGWLFTGDLYVSRRQLVAFKDENISDAINSIKNLLQLDFKTVFCGHSGIHHNGKEKLKAKLDYFLQIQEQVRYLEKTGLPHEDINRKLFPGKNLWTKISGREWSSLNIIKTI